MEWTREPGPHKETVYANQRRAHGERRQRQKRKRHELVVLRSTPIPHDHSLLDANRSNRPTEIRRVYPRELFALFSHFDVMRLAANSL